MAKSPHTQIIHYDNGKTKLTVHNVVKVWTNTMVHLLTADGTEYRINQNKVNHIEIPPVKKLAKKT